MWTRMSNPSVYPIFVATYEPHFVFEAYGKTPASARKAIERAWRAHVKQYTDAEPHSFRQADVEVHPRYLGQGYRDGSGLG